MLQWVISSSLASKKNKFINQDSKLLNLTLEWTNHSLWVTDLQSTIDSALRIPNKMAAKIQHLSPKWSSYQKGSHILCSKTFKVVFYQIFETPIIRKLSNNFNLYACMPWRHKRNIHIKMGNKMKTACSSTFPSFTIQGIFCEWHILNKLTGGKKKIAIFVRVSNKY